MLGYAVSIKEGARQINDFFTAPVHYQTWIIGNFCHNCSFQIFFIGVFDKRIQVFGFDNDGHTFLGFRDSQFCTVQAFVFFRNFIKVDDQSVGQLADSDRNAAGAEIVAAFDHCRNSRVTEQTLDLALGRRISLLYFCAAGKQRVYCMFFRRTGSTATAVTAGTAA